MCSSIEDLWVPAMTAFSPELWSKHEGLLYVVVQMEHVTLEGATSLSFHSL